jgi:hypothetical protein
VSSFFLIPKEYEKGEKCKRLCENYEMYRYELYSMTEQAELIRQDHLMLFRYPNQVFECDCKKEVICTLFCCKMHRYPVLGGLGIMRTLSTI